MFYLYDNPLLISRADLTIDNAGGNETAVPVTATTGDLAVEATSAVAGAAPEPEAPRGFWDDWGTIIIMYAAVFGVMYFLWIKPQNKKRKAVMEMQAAMKVGDSVLTSSGMYGTITMLGEQDCIVEFGTNKGIKIPIRRADIVGVRDPVLTAAVTE